MASALAAASPAAGSLLSMPPLSITATATAASSAAASLPPSLQISVSTTAAAAAAPAVSLPSVTVPRVSVECHCRCCPCPSCLSCSLPLNRQCSSISAAATASLAAACPAACPAPAAPSLPVGPPVFYPRGPSSLAGLSWCDAGSRASDGCAASVEKNRATQQQQQQHIGGCMPPWNPHVTDAPRVLEPEGYHATAVNRLWRW